MVRESAAEGGYRLHVASGMSVESRTHLRIDGDDADGWYVKPGCVFPSIPKLIKYHLREQDPVAMGAKGKRVVLRWGIERSCGSVSHLSPGDVLLHNFETRLGVGRFGGVYKGTMADTGQPVAVRCVFE